MSGWQVFNTHQRQENMDTVKEETRQTASALQQTAPCTCSWICRLALRITQGLWPPQQQDVCYTGRIADQTLLVGSRLEIWIVWFYCVWLTDNVSARRQEMRCWLCWPGVSINCYHLLSRPVSAWRLSEICLIVWSFCCQDTRHQKIQTFFCWWRQMKSTTPVVVTCNQVCNSSQVCRHVQLSIKWVYLLRRNTEVHIWLTPCLFLGRLLERYQLQRKFWLYFLLNDSIPFGVHDLELKQRL